MNAPFDILNIVTRAYVTLWKERAYIARLAAFPFLIKMVCVSATFVLLQDAGAAHALIMLPSYLADGWMAAHLARLLCLGQRWPFRPTGDQGVDLIILQDRARGVLAGAVCFTLIKIVLAGIAGLFLSMGLAKGASAAEPSPIVALVVMGGTAAFIALFRYMWAYIPASVAYPISTFGRDMRGLRTDLSLLAAWLVVFAPLFFLFRIGASVTSDPAAISIFVMIIDTIGTLVSTIAITYAIQSVMRKRK